MKPIRFRPHTLSLLTVVGGYTDEASGDYVPGSESWSEQIPCRYEPNGKARVVPVGQGKDSVYEYIVYLNTDCPDINFGQQVRLYDEEGKLFREQPALGFHRGQLDAKLWV